MVGRRLVFYHLPKSGGSSVFQALCYQYPIGMICPIRNSSFHSENHKEYYFYSGHYSPPLFRKQIKRPIKEAILFREPTARLLSEYYFTRSHTIEWILENQKNHPDMDYISAKTHDLEGYLVSQKEKLTHNILRMICGSKDGTVSQAMGIVDSIELVGVLERGLSPFLQRIFKMIHLKWDGVTPRACVFEDLTTAHEHCEELEKEPITPVISELLEEITEEERILYEHVKNLYC